MTNSAVVLDGLQEVENFIRDQVPRALLEFSPRVYEDHAELWVYVLSLDMFSNIQEVCKRLTAEHALKTFPIQFFVKTWSGPWPGGEPIEEIRKRRANLVAKVVPPEQIRRLQHLVGKACERLEIDASSPESDERLDEVVQLVGQKEFVDESQRGTEFAVAGYESKLPWGPDQAYNLIKSKGGLRVFFTGGR